MGLSALVSIQKCLIIVNRMDIRTARSLTHVELQQNCIYIPHVRIKNRKKERIVLANQPYWLSIGRSDYKYRDYRRLPGQYVERVGFIAELEHSLLNSLIGSVDNSKRYHKWVLENVEITGACGVDHA